MPVFRRYGRRVPFFPDAHTHCMIGTFTSEKAVALICTGNFSTFPAFFGEWSRIFCAVSRRFHYRDRHRNVLQSMRNHSMKETSPQHFSRPVFSKVISLPSQATAASAGFPLPDCRIDRSPDMQMIQTFSHVGSCYGDIPVYHAVFTGNSWKRHIRQCGSRPFFRQADEKGWNDSATEGNGQI